MLIGVLNHNQTMMDPPPSNSGQHNQTIVRSPKVWPQHNQTMLMEPPPSNPTQHNQTVVRAFLKHEIPSAHPCLLFA